MDRLWLMGAIGLLGLALSVVLPEGACECLLDDEVICLDPAEDLADDAGAHRALDRFARSEYGVIVPPLTAFQSPDHPDYALEVTDDAYAFTNQAASPQWSVTLEKLAHARWRVTEHSRFVTGAHGQ